MIPSNQLVGEMLDYFLTSLGNQVKIVKYDDRIQETLSQYSHWADLIIADLEHKMRRSVSDLEEIHAIFPAVPILLISSAGETIRVEEALKNGVFGYVHKPLSLSELELLLVRISEISAKRGSKKKIKMGRESDAL